jgi:hypothetical protein
MVATYLLGPVDEIFTVLSIEFALKISRGSKGKRSEGSPTAPPLIPLLVHLALFFAATLWSLNRRASCNCEAQQSQPEDIA